MSESRFPWWIVLGGFVLALGYLPTLNSPFDFTDDGNLVYPAPETTTPLGYVARWWDKVAANVEHLGPFRPVLWLHWELSANGFNGDPVVWRASRLIWCGIAAGLLVWLMRELKAHPTAALMAAAAAMWNPYRNEIWTSLTLAEGVAMPYALMALIAARKAGPSSRPWVWDTVSILSLFAALGCKNVFVAILPAQLALRMWADGQTWKEGWRINRWPTACYLLPLLMPAVHFVYFKLTWHAGQYETPGPSFEQVVRIAAWMKGAIGLDFLGVGLGITLGVLYWQWRQQRFPKLGETFTHYRAALLCGSLLFACGVIVYLPVPIMAARYTMPAVWGFDVLFALLLTALLMGPLIRVRQVALAVIGIGLTIMMVANIGRQEKLAARAQVLWDVIEYLEREGPPEARIAWIGGGTSPAMLNTEEGIHFQWHIHHRNRTDVFIALHDAEGNPRERLELYPYYCEPQYRISMAPPNEDWLEVKSFGVGYWLGRKRFACRFERENVPAPTPSYLDPWTVATMKTQFENVSRLRLRVEREAASGSVP